MGLGKALCVVGLMACACWLEIAGKGQDSWIMLMVGLGVLLFS